MTPNIFLPFLLWHLISLPGYSHHNLAQAARGGEWAVVQKSIGIVAMHMQLLKNDHVVIFDRTDYGRSNISLPKGRCRSDPNEMVVKYDCTAHSVEYDVLTNSVRPLMVQTDVWCSSGTVGPQGHLIQTGGFNDGQRVVRIFQPCGRCDWVEVGLGLLARRWYATNHILPDSRAIVIGGRREFNYEFYPKWSTAKSLVMFPFLRQTHDPKEENNLYPFVHLNVDGNLFIYANNRAILFDYKKNVVVRTYPTVPGGDPRSYPSTGSSVLLPLKNIGQASIEAEVLICGGAPRGSFRQVDKMKNKRFIEALKTCGRIKITDVSPKWTMETMPLARVMGDMILLPNGHVLIINGAGEGTAGWENAIKPVLNPVLYRPNNPLSARFELQNPSAIPRLYHSSAILVRDGRILVGGSNPHVYYNFIRVSYPTELRLEAFSPGYLSSDFSNIRPVIVSSQTRLSYLQKFTISFSIEDEVSDKGVEITMVAPPFATHSFSMSQRLLVLDGGNTTMLGNSTYQVEVMTPKSRILAPPGYYMVFVVHQDIPSVGRWVQIL